MKNATKKAGIVSAIAAFAMAACTVATLGMANGRAASAAEAEPVYAEQGWYMVGNGAGSLKDSSWLNYVPEFKLTQTAGKGKTGTFTKEGVELYQGDAFKILYASGTWEWTSDSKWTADNVAEFNNIASNADGYFVNGGLGNIQATKAGQGVYTFTLTVSETVDEEGEVTATNISLSYVKTGEVTPIAQEEMYVVGSLAGYEECNWPGSIDVRECCPAMSFDAETNKWTVRLELYEGDTFKVYNLVNNGYFPSGTNNDCVIEEYGIYEVEYEAEAPSFIVTNVITGEVVYR